MLHRKTLIAVAAAVALGCVPMATNAIAAGHQNSGHGGGGGQAFAGHGGGGGHAMAGPARGGRGSAGNAGGGRVVRSGGGYYGGGGGGYYGGGPIYDSCSGYGYGYGGCPGYVVPLVGAVINGVLGGYGGY